MKKNGVRTETSTPNRSVTECPACGSTLYRPTGPEAPGFAMIAGDETFEQSSYLIHECSNCGLLYRNPTLQQEDLDRYYAKVDFRKWDFAGYHPTERHVIGILRALPKGSRILDVGCSSGRLLASLCTEYDCCGIEVNAAAACEAASKKIKILANEDLDNPNLPKCDAIVIVDLFEHLSQPLCSLQRMLRSLADNGRLIIATGNGDASACRRDPAQFWYFRTLEHLSMLTRKHAEFLCSALGLRLEQWTELCHYDLSLAGKIFQGVQNFAYWQFRRRTLFARSVLQFLPGINRLKAGDVAPTYSCSRDHVVAVFRK